ncbi:MAG TPA: amidohydrolase family protein [Bdellovibrionota bacterium]|jgi:dihydroorotase
MSSVFRKSPLQPTEKSWIVVQKSGGAITGAWASLPGQSHLLTAKNAGDAKSLVDKAAAAGAKAREIPGHWMVLPTGIDLQVHLRHPGQAQKETLEGGLESALYGGFDTVVTMPNTQPFLDSPDALAKAIASAHEIASRYPVRVAFTASATKGMQGQEPTDIESLARAGAVAITDDGWGVKTETAQAGVFAGCARSGLLFQQHAEMPGHKGVATASTFQKSHNLPEYPRSAESEMIRRDIALLQKAKGARYHVLHVSTRESLEEIRKAKSAGLAVSAEVTPHHLFFSSNDIPPESSALSSYFKMNPPLFGPEDRAALREALRDGTIDCVSTDHAPHEKDLKTKGWLLAPFGTRGLETALPALLTLVTEGELSPSRLVEVFSSAPRKLLGKTDFLEPTGLLFVDPKASFRVTESDLPGLSENSCFLSATLHGRIEIRGEPGALFTRA